MSRREAEAANMAKEKQRGGKTVTQFLETGGAFEWMAGERPFNIYERLLIRGERRRLTPGGERQRQGLSSSASFLWSVDRQ